MLNVGDKAPAWQAKDQGNATRTSEEFLGKWYVFYFYPQDDTPGCTLEACGLRDKYSSLKQKIEVIGVSADSVDSHKKFVEKFHLPFTLISDIDRTIISAYGADGTMLPKRVTFLIDPKQTIRKIYHGFDAAQHASDIEKDLAMFGV